MIVDSHAHLGSCYVFDLTVTADEVMSSMDANGVDASVVLALPGARSERAAHDDIAELANRYPGRIFGVACPDPHQEEDAFMAEANRCVKVLGFVGLKLHTQGDACPPTSRDAAKIFSAARDLGVPLIIHTGAGAPWALPALVIPRALEYPSVKIVLAHSGGFIYSGEALIAAQLCPNIFLETSWCGTHRVRELVEKLGPGRVMFGADLPGNIGTELAKYRTSGLDAEMRQISLGATAQAVFGLA